MLELCQAVFTNIICSSQHPCEAGKVNLLPIAQEMVSLRPYNLVGVTQLKNNRGQNVNLGNSNSNWPNPFIAFSALSSLLHIRQMVLYQHL